MDKPNSAGGKITLHPVFRNPTDILIWAVIAMQLMIAFGAFPFLPPVVPIQWRINDQTAGPKWMATFLFPGISIGLWLLCVRQIVGPHLGDRAYQAVDTHWRSVLFVGIVLFLLLIQISGTMSDLSLGMHINLEFIMNLGRAALFIFLGNYLGKLHRNFWMGIQTPWTITSDVVWERTHRVGAWLFVAVGLLGIPFSFVSALRAWGIVTLLIPVAIFLFVYSYVCYRQYARH